MDLNTITEISRPRQRGELPAWKAGDAWLAGGTWLFSEPQLSVSRLIDIAEFGWPALEITEQGLRIAATCKIAELDGATFPPSWSAAPLVNRCCRSFLASFKIWNMATVGGNLCMSLPAGPMISLTAALDGVCVIWTPEGDERHVAVRDFVLAPLCNALRPGSCSARSNCRCRRCAGARRSAKSR
jgi:CO/xanthine dehydrogenase FAD-binding subunit